jgi:hypothetical protein
MSTTLIHVTKTDNELYILAIQEGSEKGSPAGLYSSELCHIKSGYSDRVDYRFRPGACLAPGNYTLVMIGINWGGPQAFEVTLTTNGVQQTYSSPAGNTAPGTVWSESVNITVP